MKFAIGQRVNIVKVNGDTEWADRISFFVGMNGTIKSTIDEGDTVLYYQVVPDGYESSLIDFSEDELSAV